MSDVNEATSLGDQLHQLRSLTGESLRRVADSTGYSTAYLAKLERDEVRSPSPHLLEALAKHFSVSYLSLMSLAGYETSDPGDQIHRGPARSDAVLIADALTSERFTNSERQAIAAFINSLKRRTDRDG